MSARPLADLTLAPAHLAQVQALQAGFEASALPLLVDVWAWQALPAAFHPQIEAAYVVLQSGADLCGTSAV